MGNKKYIFAIALFLIVGMAIYSFASSNDKVTVSFYTAGGTDVDSVTINSGDMTSAPKTTREGYKFIGWFLYDEIFDFSTKITEDITLSAKWEALESKEDETQLPTKKDEEKDKDTSSIIDTEKDKDTEEKDDTKDVDAAPIKYTVTFVFGNGTANKAYVLDAGKKLTTAQIPANPTRSGYTFKGWKSSNNLGTGSVISKNTTFTAQWQVDTYVIEVSKIDELTPARKFRILKNGSPITDDVTAIDGFYSLNNINGYIYADASQLTVSSYKITYGGKTFTATKKDI